MAGGGTKIARTRTSLPGSCNLVDTLDVNSYVHDVEVEVADENLDQFISKWFGSPYAENSAPWEVILIRTPPKDETVVVYRVSHSLSDGYNMINLLDVLTGNKAPYLVKDFDDSWLDKVQWKIIWKIIVARHLSSTG